MTDYAKLIERLRSAAHSYSPSIFTEAADALERLNVENAELATQHSTLLSWYDRLRAELESAKPLLEAAAEELTYWRKLDNAGDVMVVDNWTFAKNTLRDAARTYAAAYLDAKKGGST